ncbi:MAG: hypothetical protein AAF583_01660 [Pseudomonadota bacterium]
MFGTLFERKRPAYFLPLVPILRKSYMELYENWKRQVFIPAHSGPQPVEVRYIEVFVTPDLETMEATKERLDEARVGREGQAYRFNEMFLRSQLLPDETLANADQRLLVEYETLEARRPLADADESRREELYSQFYDFKG